ncbi:hypothetical protein P389DRAFT_61098 [Cystobasidium minutum MCA 4210]|uniref:uncharacterized protein n=1 Tax=Cystobasidium minutum MCA 4210 TaxID=1397322 RepID=UPI0034CD9F83|eukprot:jgi/Rhomi1/61098/CE61097_298
MRRSLPRIGRGRSSAKSTASPPWPARSVKKSEEEQSLPIYTRVPDWDDTPSRRPPSLLEAHLHANVEVLPKRPLRRGSEEDARPTGREVPVGTVTHLPNAYTGHGRQSHDLSPIPTPYSSLRRKPSFRRASLSAVDTYESYLQRSQRSLSPRRVGEKNRLLRNSARRMFSTSNTSFASGSNVLIEDLDAMDLQAFEHYKHNRDASSSPHTNNDFTFEQNQDPTTAEGTPDELSIVTSDQAPQLEAVDRARQKKAAAHAQYIGGVRMLVPQSPGHLTGILSQAVKMTKGRTVERLQQLCIWHDRYPELQTTASYNLLLQYAYDLRHLRTFNHILELKMPKSGIKKDSVTWDLEMESYARHGKWKKVVECWTARREAGIPLNPVGWTRLAQAVTKRGTTSLSEADVGTSMNPIYSALYDLPKGVRQVQLHKLAMQQKMDVDQMLALMMPDNLEPLDFEATLVVAHRLAKQLRWREAEDVVALYLDRTAETWEKQLAEPREFRRDLDDRQAAKLAKHRNRIKAARRQQSAALLHILLECLVISRSSPEMLHAYVENYLVRYENTGVKPEYHTLFFILSAYRVQPLETRFKKAHEHFISLEETYRPSYVRRTDKFGLSRCLRHLQTYARLALNAYCNVPEKKELCDYIQLALRDINARMQEVVLAMLPASAEHDRREQVSAWRSPRRHVVIKEKFKGIEKPAIRKLYAPQKHAPDQLSKRSLGSQKQ